MTDWRTNDWQCEYGCQEYDGGCDWCRFRLEELADELSGLDRLVDAVQPPRGDFALTTTATTKSMGDAGP